MAQNTETFLEIKRQFSKEINDDLEFDTTTNITTSKAVISTALNNYDDSEIGHFDNRWVEITEGNNIGVERRTGSTTYATSSGTLYVYGANLSAESAAVTCRLHKNNPARKSNAILDALKDIYPELHIPIDDQTLITGNILPDAHFEVWSSASALTHYTVLSGTLAQTSTAGLHRGGTYSAKYTAGANNDYFYISSDSYPRLLELQNKSVNFYCMAYPEVADDAYIEIYTVSKDGSTTQTLTSTTTCSAGVFTMLALESQGINDNLEEIQIRFKIGTNTKYVYFDDAFLCGMRMSEYLMPDTFIEGQITRVYIQQTGHLDPMAYDTHPFSTYYPGEQVPFEVIHDGTYKYLKLIDDYSTERRIRLIGDKPLEQPASGTGTVTIDSRRIPLLTAKARMIYWQREAVPVTQEQKDKLDTEYIKAARDYSRLLGKMRMTRFPLRI